MKSILESLREKVIIGSLTIREAAIVLHKSGWINFIDVDATQKLLKLESAKRPTFLMNK
ncbi:hypothetical protein [Bacteroides finegoldii]|uniref:hypothetical protein n=1 Tax=Bacteroides finegoldii TaxID=338188 RepID=UPI00189F18A6|nr:hypothetical protein [Bacteroides finegoldii]